MDPIPPSVGPPRASPMHPDSLPGFVRTVAHHAFFERALLDHLPAWQRSSLPGNHAGKFSPPPEAFPALPSSRMGRKLLGLAKLPRNSSTPVIIRIISRRGALDSAFFSRSHPNSCALASGAATVGEENDSPGNSLHAAVSIGDLAPSDEAGRNPNIHAGFVRGG